MNWLEVSLTVDGELAEAVAEVLARFAPNGVMTEQGIQFLDDEDHGTPSGPVVVRAYLEMNARIEETRQKLEESLFFLGMIQPVPVPTYNQIADQNWMEAWKQHYKPIPIAKRLIILPVWLESPTSERIPIRIDPGMAFGTGTHPTTQLCLELIEKADLENRDMPTENQEMDANINEKATQITVIDVGCGSGILSIAALKLGAQIALGIDIDIESVKNARENANNNGIGAEFIIAHGSVKEVLEGRFPLKQATLVVANILAPIIVRLFDEGLADLVEPNGTVILSGIMRGQEQNILDAAQTRGFELREQRQMGDWVALVISRTIEGIPG